MKKDFTTLILGQRLPFSTARPPPFSTHHFSTFLYYTQFFFLSLYLFFPFKHTHTHPLTSSLTAYIIFLKNAVLGRSSFAPGNIFAYRFRDSFSPPLNILFFFYLLFLLPEIKKQNSLQSIQTNIDEQLFILLKVDSDPAPDKYIMKCWLSARFLPLRSKNRLPKSLGLVRPGKQQRASL